MDGDAACSDIGNDPDCWSCFTRLQFDASDDTIPVALRLVGDAMGVLADANVFDAVVNTDANGVLATKANERSDVVLVGR